MDKIGKVSVIITTYGKPYKLVRAINSVLNQTYKNIELMVVDDNNPDTEARKAVENIMIDYVNKFQDKVIYIQHEKIKMAPLQGIPA